MILRDGAAGLEVLLGRRRKGRAFGEAHVFPGGVLEAEDHRLTARCDGPSAEQACQQLSLAGGALAYWVAAVREVFEETGIAFLAGDELALAQLPGLRRALLSGRLSFNQLCADYGLAPRLSGLHYVAHWITPAARPLRFDTRFFVAELPAGQQAVHDGWELTDTEWLAPAAALARMRAGELKLAPPTIVELERLSRFQGVANAVTWARGCWLAGVPAILPVVERDKAGERIHMAGEPAAALARARQDHD